MQVAIFLLCRLSLQARLEAKFLTCIFNLLRCLQNCLCGDPAVFLGPARFQHTLKHTFICTQTGSLAWRWHMCNRHLCSTAYSHQAYTLNRSMDFCRQQEFRLCAKKMWKDDTSLSKYRQGQSTSNGTRIFDETETTAIKKELLVRGCVPSRP